MAGHTLGLRHQCPSYSLEPLRSAVIEAPGDIVLASSGALDVYESPIEQPMALTRAGPSRYGVPKHGKRVTAAGCGISLPICIQRVFRSGKRPDLC